MELNAANIDRIAEGLKTSVRCTPVISSPQMQSELGFEHPIFWKAENLQFTGSFKLRGSGAKLQSILQEARKKGVVTASAGNHAQGVAYHAQALGIKAVIVMPEATPLVKVKATRDMGAEVRFFGESYLEAYEEADRLRREEGYLYVHAFNDEYVMAGQGSVAKEILEQVPDVGTVLIPVGGGGLLAGCVAYLKERKPEVKIIAVQAEGANSLAPSLKAGHCVRLDEVKTVAEGIAVKQMGDKAFKVIQSADIHPIVVNEKEISRGVFWLLEKERMLGEGCAGAVVAACYKAKHLFKGPTVAVLSGGNLDAQLLIRMIERGLVDSGRRYELKTTLIDKPGSLGALLSCIAKARASVLHVDHERVFGEKDVREVSAVVQMETEGPHHIHEVREALRRGGWL